MVCLFFKQKIGFFLAILLTKECKKGQLVGCPHSSYKHQSYCCLVAPQQSQLPLLIDSRSITLFFLKATNHFSVHYPNGLRKN